jgi:HEAT repeat protein
MLSIDLLQLAVSLEGVLLLMTLTALIVLRIRIAARRRSVEAGVQAVEPELRAWLVLDESLDGLVATLGRLSPHAAFRSLARLVTQQVPVERQRTLAAVLRHQPWVERILRHTASRLWWQRFDAARLLSIVGGPDDVGRIAALLDDRSPAVRLVAIDAAARLHGRPLVEKELDDLPTKQDAVQAYQFAALARHPGLVAESLAVRLRADAPSASLIAWIDAAGALAIPSTLYLVRELAVHPIPEVRLHVARALRRLADPDTPPVLLTLLVDADWRVRAQAARALGALRCGAAIPALAQAVCDPAWWVRYRSALALAQIGASGREALRRIAAGDDRLARDMSVLVRGLSAAAVVEMAEV